MKFVAVIRQVPDGESKLRIQGDRVDLSGATMILDQMDEYAVEEAIRLIGDPQSDGLCQTMKTELRLRNSVSFRYGGVPDLQQ